MIRRGYSSEGLNDEYFSDDDDGEVNAPPSKGSVGKRKFDEREDCNAIQRLESLNLDSDNEDILLLESEEEDLLLEPGEEQATNPPARRLKLNKPKTDSTPSTSKTSGNDDAGGCQMKWLRTVGLNQDGVLRCTVSAAADTLSESGRSGKAESVMADTIRGMINLYYKKRCAIIDDNNGIVATPLHVVKKLAMDHGEMLHIEVLSLPTGYHRLEMFSGHVRGVGEGPNKKIAAQMAAIDILERIQLSGGTVKLPLVGFFPGWLISNRVYGDLISLCDSKGLPRPKFTCKLNLNEDGILDPKYPPYHAECWVGSDLVTIGESETEVFARREAAKEMYQLIANIEYKDIPYAIGKCCRSVAELNAAGYRQLMSDYKKKWLFLNRMANNQLEIPEDEAGLDDPIEVSDLEKGAKNIECLGYELVKKQALKVTVKNKKLKTGSEDSDEPSVRKISVENADDAKW